MANLSTEDILNLAKLSKLDLSTDQVERFRKEIGEIMQYVEQLQNVNVEGLQPTSQVSGLHTVTRTDETREYATREELLKNLPSRDGDYIKVKRVIE